MGLEWDRGGPPFFFFNSSDVQLRQPGLRNDGPHQFLVIKIFSHKHFLEVEEKL